MMVQAARTRAIEAGFDFSEDDRVGGLLSVMAAGVPKGAGFCRTRDRAGAAQRGSSSGSMVQRTWS